MPFTPSHVAAALPFVRTPLLPAALVIGTMVPDLFYYLPVDVDRGASHSWVGVVTVDLAFGIGLVLLWKLFLRTPVVDFMPTGVRARLKPSEWMPRGRLRVPRLILLVIASLLIGSATHVLWDSLTHDGPFVHLVPVLYEQVGPLRVFKWLQHASSLLGAIVLVVFARRWYGRAAVHDVPPSKLGVRGRVIGWIAVIASGLVVAGYAWVRGFLVHGYTPIDNALVFYVVTIGIAAAGLATVLVSVVWWGLGYRDGPDTGRRRSGGA